MAGESLSPSPILTAVCDGYPVTLVLEGEKILTYSLSTAFLYSVCHTNLRWLESLFLMALDTDG